MGAGFSGVPSGTPFGLPSTVSGATPATRLPGRGQGAAEAEPAPAAALASAAPPDGIPRRVLIATHLHSLRYSWSEVYEVAACVLGGTETWTGVRLDASGVITAGDWVTFGVLLREDHGCYPHGGPIRRVPYDLASVRTGHPGFAVITVPGGFMAFRGSRAWPEHGEDPLGLPALDNVLCAQEFEDARLAAAAAKM